MSATMTSACLRTRGYQLGDEIRKATFKGVTLRHGVRVADGIRLCFKIISKEHMTEVRGAAGARGFLDSCSLPLLPWRTRCFL